MTRLRNESGQILILSAGVLIVFLMLATVVVDVGNWFVHRRHLQTQVDAAALATSDQFTGCFINSASANAAIKSEALKFAGDPNRDPSTENKQVTPDNTVHVVLNSSDYWPNRTEATEMDLGTFCGQKFVDVKATDDDVPGILGLIPFFPDIHAHARAEIRKAGTLTGILPWAVPEVEPASVWAIFYNEALPSTTNPLRVVELSKGVIAPVNGASYQLYNGPADVAIAAKTGVIIMTSDSLTPVITGSLASICGATNVQCRAKDSSGNYGGLAMLAQPGNTAGKPQLTNVNFGAGDCTDDTSAGYFLKIAECSPQVTATIDFGPGAASPPTNAPTFARVYLVGPGCPTSPDPGCPMSFRSSDQQWVASTPKIIGGAGPADYSIAWATGGSGPGGPVLTAFTGPEAGATSVLTAAQPVAPTRNLALALANTCGTGESLTVTKVVDNKGVTVGALTFGDFQFSVSPNNQASCDTEFFEADGSNNVTIGNSNYDVSEVNTPSGYSAVRSGCSNIGKNKTCTITNTTTRAVATLRVTKTVVNDDNGGKAPTDFGFTVTPVSGPAKSFTFPAGGTIDIPVFANSPLNVVEGADAGYTTTYGNSANANLNCSNLTIAANQTTTCTITNDDVGPGKGTLAIVKNVTNDDGGAKQPQNFSFKIDGGASQQFATGTPTTSTLTLALSTGSHTLVEDADSGYTSSPASCTVTVTKVGVATCTFANDDKPGSLTVIKQVVGAPDNPNKWTMTVTGPTNTTVPGDAGGQTRPVKAGSYSISETGGPAGFGLSFPAGANQDCSPSGSVTVGNGQSKTCILVNTFGAAGGPADSGQWNNVGRVYAADLLSGPVGYVKITDPNTTAPSYFFTSGGTKNVNVSVGIAGQLLAARSNDPVYLLRWASAGGSRTQLLDCDHPNRGPDEEIATGCETPYAINLAPQPQQRCDSLYGNGGLPPNAGDIPYAAPDPPYPICIAVKPTSQQASMAKGMVDRFESPCTTNNWPKTSLDPAPLPEDPRYVTLVITSYGSFDPNGSGNVPILRFARFYVTGWGSKKNGGGNSPAGCPGNDPAPPGADPKNDFGDVWGHFTTYTLPSSDGEPGPDLCDFTEAGVCILGLTQ